MIDKDTAVKYLQRRITEHDLGVSNGGDMDPDVVALSAIVLAMDDKLDEVLDYIERCTRAGHDCQDHRGGSSIQMATFFEAMWTALLKNKTALVSVLSAIIAFFAAQIIQFFEVRRFLGMSGEDGVVLFIILVMFMLSMVFVIFHSTRR